MPEVPTKEQVKPVEAKVEKPSTTKYFRCNRGAGLRFLVSVPGDNPVLNKYVSFKPRKEKHEGYVVLRGYLETDDPNIIERASKLSYVEEITEKEYKG